MNRLFAIAALVCVSPFAVAQAPVDVAGTWTTQTEVQGIAVNETCHLAEAADGTLSGVCETSAGKYKLTGKVSGSSVNFTHPANYQQEDMVVSFFGKLDEPTSVSGSIDIQPINAGGTFAMKKIGK